MREVSPKLKGYLEELNATVAKLVAAGFKPNATNAREGLANLTATYVTKIPEVALIQDDIVPAEGYQVPVRIYNPAPEEELPVLIYYHGGGGMAGSVTVYDPICRKIALATRHIVIAPEYRLAPECPYPAGVNDAYATLKGAFGVLAARGMKFKRELSIAGDSGGGALCGSVSGLAQFDASVKIKKQFLIYPSVDYTMDTKSMEENAVGYLLQAGKVAWYFDNYFKNGECRKAASPLYGDFTRKLPETFVVTAEFCPLRDEGKAYCEKLIAANVAAHHVNMESMIHTFMNLEDLVPEECAFVYDKMNEFLNS
ncbi:alpha/beta hydrolase [Breoghania sp.]|uniref:alpha/beta hydrolase n=1 Tax=Breoghania sp. TaxID=2065378 RepID=UPI002AABAC07|nr:alpha/beta hydrolase [Breoghania sp.]